MVNLKEVKHTEDSVTFNVSDQIIDRLKNQLDTSTAINFLIRIGIVAIAPILLKVYNVHLINTLNAQKDQVNQELLERKSEIDKLNKKITAFDGIKAKAKEFEDKFAVLEKLAHKRLKIIKILDSIQTQLGYEGEEQTSSKNFMFLKNVKINEKSVTIEGLSNNEQTIKDFLISLEEENLYENIRLERVISNKEEALKRFFVKGNILEEI